MNVPRFIRRLFRAPYDGLRHFGVVQEGVLYRCGQPTPDELEQLIERLGLRSVVSLRGSRSDSDPDAWEQDERRTCEARGVAFISIPCNHKNPPTAEQVEQFLALTRDPARRPALVHCRLGQQRTQLFCGLFRVHELGENPQAVLRDMDQLGFNSRHRRHQQLLAVFHKLTGSEPAGMTERKLGGGRLAVPGV